MLLICLTARAGVHEIATQEFDAYEKKEEVIFLYFYDQATTSEDFVLNPTLRLLMKGST